VTKRKVTPKVGPVPEHHTINVYFVCVCVCVCVCVEIKFHAFYTSAINRDESLVGNEHRLSNTLRDILQSGLYQDGHSIQHTSVPTKWNCLSLFEQYYG
jgi:hypothetical protein